MKKIIFGGFCMISGILLLWLSITEGFYININLTPLMTVISFLLLIGGFVMGIIGLKDK